MGAGPDPRRGQASLRHLFPARLNKPPRRKNLTAAATTPPRAKPPMAAGRPAKLWPGSPLGRHPADRLDPATAPIRLNAVPLPQQSKASRQPMTDAGPAARHKRRSRVRLCPARGQLPARSANQVDAARPRRWPPRSTRPETAVAPRASFSRGGRPEPRPVGPSEPARAAIRLRLVRLRQPPRLSPREKTEVGRAGTASAGPRGSRSRRKVSRGPERGQAAGRRKLAQNRPAARKQRHLQVLRRMAAEGASASNRPRIRAPGRPPASTRMAAASPPGGTPNGAPSPAG